MNRSLIVLALALAAGCASKETAGPVPVATADIRPTAGSQTAGTVRFEQRGSKVLVSAEVRGLKPGVEHGFHIHEKGDCSAPDAMSAGGHFNPAGKPHGHHGQNDRHAGDLPSLVASASGTASLRFETDIITVTPGAASVIDRGIVVHRDPDDYKTQPTGNSGPRLACGVIAARN